MRVLKLEIADKTFMSGKITTYLTKQAIRLQKDALAFAKNAQAIDQTDLDSAEKVMDDLLNLQDRKTWLLCEAFGNQFTADVVEQNLSHDEVDTAVNQLIGNIGATIEKN